MKYKSVNKILHNSRGTTLVEIMISILLLSIILLIATKYLIISLSTFHSSQKKHNLSQKARYISIYISNIMESNLNSYTDSINGETKIIYNSKNIPIIDFRGKNQTPSIGTEVYFVPQQKQLRTNRNGEHVILLENVEGINMFEKDNVVDCTMTLLQDNVKETTTFPIPLHKEDI